MFKKIQSGMNEEQAIFAVVMELPLSFIPTERIVELLRYALRLERIRTGTLSPPACSTARATENKIVRFLQSGPSAEEVPATTLIL